MNTITLFILPQKKKPVELFYDKRANMSSEEIDKIRQVNIEKLVIKQNKDIEIHNRNRKPVKNYKTGDIIYVRHNKRLGSK